MFFDYCLPNNGGSRNVSSSETFQYNCWNEGSVDDSLQNFVRVSRRHTTPEQCNNILIEYDVFPSVVPY